MNLNFDKETKVKKIGISVTSHEYKILKLIAKHKKITPTFAAGILFRAGFRLLRNFKKYGNSQKG